MARIKIKNKNSLPKGYTIRKGKCIKTYAAGGATVSNTLSSVDREAANLEAEKDEMVLTDTTGDGVFELYGVGGNRHSEGGTPLNLPDQSFVFSDTRAMLLTKDEMKSLGIEQKKRLTPAKAAKKFPLNKFIKILEDETSDKIAVETAEQMINKNKISLSQIAFIQESKKDFDNGLPLAAFPFLMSKGINPEEFQQKIQQMQAEKEGQGQGQPTHQMPDGSMMPGASHQEAMGAPQGGQQMLPPEMMQQMMAQQGPPQGMPPQGMMPPPPPTNVQANQMMMGRYGGSLPKFMAGAEATASVVPAATTIADSPMGKLASLFQGFKRNSYTDVESGNQVGNDDDSYVCPAYGNPPPSAAMQFDADINNNYQGPGMNAKYGTELKSFQTEGQVDPQELIETLQNPDYQKLITKCKTSLCSYEEWLFAYRMRDIKEVRFMYESYKTKAIDKMKASGIDTEIMPGHENMPNATYDNMPKQQYGTETGQPMVPQMGVPEGYVRDQNPLGLPGYKHGGMYEDEGEGLSRFVQGGTEINNAGVRVEQNRDIQLDPLIPSYEQNPYYRDLSNKLQIMQQQYISALDYREENPNKFDKKAQEEFSMHLSVLQNQMMSIDYEMKVIQEKLSLESSMLDIGTSTPNINVSDISEYTGANPAMEGNQMMMAKNGIELPRYDLGDHICVGDDCTSTAGKKEHDDQKHDLQNTGIDAHMEFQNMINSDVFSGVKQGWIDAYRAIEQNYKDIVAKHKVDPASLSKLEKQLFNNPPATGTISDADLINGFMKMNQKLVQSSAAGIDHLQWKQDGSGYYDICIKMGWGDATSCKKGNEAGNQDNKIFQGMFAAMQALKNSENASPQTERFFGNIKTDLGGSNVGHTEMIDPVTKLPMSFFDGVIGYTSAGQGMTVQNKQTEKIITHDVKCDAETRARKEKECAKKNTADKKNTWTFNLEKCNCQVQPGDPEIKEIPPYMTFPQDDLRLQNAIDTKWGRNLYMPQRMHEDAITPEVAYQDPQAMIQANLSMAGQMAKMDPENASFYMGSISDKLNKGISDVANTNIKIFDNNQARVASALGQTQDKNTEYKDEYNTRYATALNNWDNTRIADNINITDTQVERQDHADKLFAINTENPNYYYDAQAHRNQFYNPEDMYASDALGTNVSMSDAHAECKTMGFKDNTSQMNVCIKQRMATNTATSTLRPDLDETENKVESTANVKHGKEIGCTSCDNDKRRKELARSKKALRDWIFGI